jgi:hypothetical protein
MALHNDRPQVEVLIAGRPAELTIDLGSGGEIALRQEAWDRLGIGEFPTSPSRSVNPTGVITNSIAAEVDHVSLGPRIVKDVDVALTPSLPDRRDGYLGFGLLSRFNFAIDIKARRLWLIPPFPAE